MDDPGVRRPCGAGKTARLDTVDGQARSQTPHRPETPLWWFSLGFLVLLVPVTVLDLDVQLSQVFYQAEAAPHWFLSAARPWSWLYYYGEYPAFVLALGAAAVWGGSLRYRPWVRYRRACAFFVLAVALGPGVLVNVVVKPLWGRPRPKQTELFGSSRVYRPWWQPGQIGGGRSLPSGHASMGYVLVASTPLLAAGGSLWRRRGVLAVALSYGSLLGLTRIIQGGHFVTDVLWSGCLICALVALLHRLLPATGGLSPPASQAPGWVPH